MRAVSALAILLGVSACGGGGGTIVQSTTPTGPPELLAYIADQERIAQLIISNNGSNAAAFTAEGSNNVVFNGVMILDEVVNAPSGAYYGDMQATVNFSGAGTLNGSAGTFVYFDDSGTSTQGTPVGGTLTLQSTSLTPDDPNSPNVEEFPIVVGGSLDLVGSGTTAVSGSSVGGAFAGPTPAGTTPSDTASDVQWLAGRGTTTLGSQTFETLIVGER